MEYRMRYRDIPWGVAVCVLPGKIIGRCIIHPIQYVKRYPMRILKKIGKFLMVCLITVVICAVATVLVDRLTDGDFGNWIRVEILHTEPVHQPEPEKVEAKPVNHVGPH